MKSPTCFTSKSLAPRRHGFFTRLGGISSNEFQSLNCGLNSKDLKENVLTNRSRIANTLGIEHGNLLFLNQKHTTRIVVLEDNCPPELEADGMVTTRQGLGLGILTADCQPILLSEAKSGVTGAIHAGWKGTLKGIIGSVLDEMTRLGADRHNIRAVIGPAISKGNYEFGRDLRDKFVDNMPESEHFFDNYTAHTFLFDLVGFSRNLFLKEEVNQVEIIDLCTYQNEAWFFSCRRSFHNNAKSFGLNASVIVS